MNNNLDQHNADESYAFKFNDANIRLNFIRKVYSILATQLLFTAVAISITVKSSYSQQFFMENQWLLALGSITFMITSYALFCYRSLARKVPLNYVLLTLCTAGMVVMVCSSVALVPPEYVLIAAVLTASITIGLTIYAFTTKSDFTVCGGMLFMLSLLLLGVSILALFFQSKMLDLVIGFFSILLFGVYLIYDTQLIVGGKNYQLEIDDYIVGALALYIDIMRIFLEIIRILQLLNRR